jgi:hypothetical protein
MSASVENKAVDERFVSVADSVAAPTSVAAFLSPPPKLLLF